MLALILLILILLFLNQEVFNTPYKYVKSQEGYNQGYINPFHEEEYNISGPDNEYYYDLSGRKGIMFRIIPESTDGTKQDDILNNPEKTPEKKDHFDAILNKLEIYNENIYNNCNKLPFVV